MSRAVVKVNRSSPGGIAVSSSLSMYGSYALSNVVVANSAGVLTFQGDGGCANYASENVVDVAVPGSAVAGLNLWFKTPLNASECIAGGGTTASQVVRDVGKPLTTPGVDATEFEHPALSYSRAHKTITSRNRTKVVQPTISLRDRKFFFVFKVNMVRLTAVSLGAATRW